MSTMEPRLRRKKTAAEKRDQRARAAARYAGRLAKDMARLGHRGSQPTAAMSAVWASVRPLGGAASCGGSLQAALRRWGWPLVDAETEAEAHSAVVAAGAAEADVVEAGETARGADSGDGFPADSLSLVSRPERSRVGQAAALGADGCGFPADPLSLVSRPEGSRVGQAKELDADAAGRSAEACVPGPWADRYVFPEEVAEVRQAAAEADEEAGSRRIRSLFRAETDVLGLQGLSGGGVRLI